MIDSAIEGTFVDFECPHCGFLASFPDAAVGSPQECPRCLEVLIVPTAGSQVGSKLPIPITTSRLRLRRLVHADSKDLIELMADEGAFPYVEWTPLDEAEIDDWLVKDKATRLTQKGGSLCFGIELSGNSKLIGSLSLYYLEDDHQEMGFAAMINPTYRRRGFGAEAVRGAMAFAFTGIRVHRIAVSCDSRNIAACRMFERAGMRREGECIKDRFRKGEWVNTVWYAMLREEHDHAS